MNSDVFEKFRIIRLALVAYTPNIYEIVQCASDELSKIMRDLEKVVSKMTGEIAPGTLRYSAELALYNLDIIIDFLDGLECAATCDRKPIVDDTVEMLDEIIEVVRKLI